MKKSSIIQKQKDAIKRSKVTFFVGIAIAAALLAAGLIEKDSQYSVLYIVTAVLVFLIMQFVGITLLSRISKTKLIGIKQSHEYDDKIISVYDEFKGDVIENSFTWDEIKYMEEINFTPFTDAILGHKCKGIMMIAHKDEFYKGLNRKLKTLNKLKKRRAKLSGGFFIQCTEEEFDEIRQYWGKEIKKDIY